MIDALRERAARAGILLDFDGSLAPIVARPELAAPAEGVREALAALTGRYAVVAIVTGRRAEEVAELIAVPGVRYEGLYGLENSAPELLFAILPEVERAAAAVPEAWVEDKGVSVAVHYRQAPDPQRARSALMAGLEPVAAGAGMVVVEGKMVLEVVPADHPMKGGAVERLAREHELRALLYAGDDHADLDAFDALDRLIGSGDVRAAVRVAVRGPETPPTLLNAADVVAESPAGLVELLRTL